MITWNDPIKGYLAPSVTHMEQISGLDLSDYQVVKDNTEDRIWPKIRDKKMPPGGWPDNQIADFKTWMDNGFPEGDAPEEDAPTWDNPIQGYFEDGDKLHMKQISGGNIDLGSYDSVKKHARRIYQLVSTGKMPPSFEGMPQKDIDNFETWKDNGTPESSTDPNVITYENTIRLLFSPYYIRHMKQVSGRDLGTYATVSAGAEDIYKRLIEKDRKKRMPPPTSSWSEAQITNFGQWVEAGCPKG